MISKQPWTRHVTIGSWFVQDADGRTIFIINRTRDIVTKPDPNTSVRKTVPIPSADADCQLLFAAPTVLERARELYSWAVDAFGPEGAPIPADHPITKMREAIEAAITVKDGAAAAREYEAERERSLNEAFGVQPPANGEAAP